MVNYSFYLWFTSSYLILFVSSWQYFDIQSNSSSDNTSLVFFNCYDVMTRNPCLNSCFNLMYIALGSRSSLLLRSYSLRSFIFFYEQPGLHVLRCETISVLFKIKNRDSYNSGTAIKITSTTSLSMKPFTPLINLLYNFISLLK